MGQVYLPEARGTLRPLIKQWLDAHLPALVERLVRIEIERVVGRAVARPRFSATGLLRLSSFFFLKKRDLKT